MKNLVIVESPAKAKTLEKYLGPDYKVMASYGHVRDLVPKKGAVDTEHGFKMKYQLLEKNKKHVEAIEAALKNADSLYLATDPDREGEAISWHLFSILEDKGLLHGKTVKRIVFNEITKQSVLQAIRNPRDLLLDLVNAQQARRALDYLVGFNLSPLLWKKIRKGLSAGRVQSPALQMIVEREEAIGQFVAREYWTIEAKLLAPQEFKAKLWQLGGEKLEQFTIDNKKQAFAAKDSIIAQANDKLQVIKVKKSQRRKSPAAPFTTSTLQQECARKLGFTTTKTMRTAQSLYEGVEVGGNVQGLITYMRTDAVYLAAEAKEAIKELIANKYGAQYVPKEERVFKNKAKNAQEAHEAIRPTDINLLPEKIKSSLSSDQYKIYNLIWQRTVASQMENALIDALSIDLSYANSKHQDIFRATGNTIAFAGFMKVYLEGKDNKKDEEEDEEKLLPALEEGDIVSIKEILPLQHFTEPPPRFTEASLVKNLEEYGIGRPSTYAAIISTLQQREYAKLEQKKFMPTDVGKIVNKFLTTYFPQYVDYTFTAKLEDSLDHVAEGEKPWLPLLEEFWQPFIKLVHEIEEQVQRKDVTQEQLEENCPKCQGQLSIRLGKRGRFVGCTNYPECDYTRSLEGETQEVVAPEIVPDRKCPDCQHDLIIKRGKYGKFIGCSNYPACKYMEKLNREESTHINCPSCHKAELIKRKSRFGTFFYACQSYPECKYAINSPPLAENCPTCQWPILMLKTTKRRGQEKVCPQKDCGYSVSVTALEEE